MCDTAGIPPGPGVVMLVKNSFQFDSRVRKEAASLVEAGYRVTVLALHVPGATARSERLPEGVDVVRVESLTARRPGWAGPSTALGGAGTGTGARTGPGAARRLLRVAAPLVQRVNAAVVDRRLLAAGRRLRPDVVHAHDLNTLSAGVRLARACGARLVYDAHEFHRARNGMDAAGAAAAARLEDDLAPRADLVVTATATWADRLQQLWGGARPVVLRNVPLAVEVPRAVDVHAAAGVPAGSPLLLYIGSIQTGRGIEEAVAALPQLPGVHVVVVGYGSHVPAVRRMADRAGLADRVHVLPAIDNHDVVDWSAGADVGLCLIADTSYSYRTSLPNKLLDYVQARVPVLASDLPEMGGLVRRTGVGEVCDPTSPDDVARAVRRILDDPDRYRTALDRAAQELVWENEVSVLLRAYERLSARSGGRP